MSTIDRAMQRVGEKPPPSDPAGRREVDVALRVSIAAGAGIPHEHIALALGIPLRSFEKAYREALACGAYLRRVEIAEALYGAAKGGNTGAAKAYLSLEPKWITPPHGGRRPGTKVKAEAPKAEAIGKKVAQERAATTAHVGTGWEALLAPTT